MFSLISNQGNINENKSEIIFSIHKASQNVKYSIFLYLQTFQWLTSDNCLHHGYHGYLWGKSRDGTHDGLCNILFLKKIWGKHDKCWHLQFWAMGTWLFAISFSVLSYVLEISIINKEKQRNYLKQSVDTEEYLISQFLRRLPGPRMGTRML